MGSGPGGGFVVTAPYWSRWLRVCARVCSHVVGRSSLTLERSQLGNDDAALGVERKWVSPFTSRKQKEVFCVWILHIWRCRETLSTLTEFAKLYDKEWNKEMGSVEETGVRRGGTGIMRAVHNAAVLGAPVSDCDSLSPLILSLVQMSGFLGMKKSVLSTAETVQGDVDGARRTAGGIWCQSSSCSSLGARQAGDYSASGRSQFCTRYSRAPKLLMALSGLLVIVR